MKVSESDIELESDKEKVKIIVEFMKSKFPDSSFLFAIEKPNNSVVTLIYTDHPKNAVWMMDRLSEKVSRGVNSCVQMEERESIADL